MFIKVCGLNSDDNIKAVDALNVDFIGHIFYEKSLRMHHGVGICTKAKKVGVFVDESLEMVREKVKEFNLKCVQLHGNESVDYCVALKKDDLMVIKAFSLNSTFNFAVLKPYVKVVDCFLFDACGENPGGNGVKFNWDILSRYNENVPFWLSGGIGYSDALEIYSLAQKWEQMQGVDVNSRFETAPGIKDVYALKKFIEILKN